MEPKTLNPKTRTRALILGGVLLLLALVLLGRGLGAAPAGEHGASTEERVAFLASCGWEADAGGEQGQIIHIPERFPAVFEDYNDLQRSQGYDLRDYAGRDCELYTYPVTNWPDDTQTVLANLYVFHGRIIGGDVHSTNLNGFMVGLK